MPVPRHMHRSWQRARLALGAGIAGVLSMLPATAWGFTVSLGIWGGSGQQVYLQVGVGSFTGLYNASGSPGTNPTINTVSVTVPVGAIGDGTPQAMSANAGAISSFYDGASMCNAGQLYIGAYFRRTNNGNVNATLTATPSGPLTNAAGDTIALSQISWTLSGNRSGGGSPFSPGSFTGAPQQIALVNRNTWTERCFDFSYANTVTPASGSYTARVTYTLVSP